MELFLAIRWHFVPSWQEAVTQTARSQTPHHHFTGDTKTT